MFPLNQRCNGTEAVGDHRQNDGLAAPVHVAGVDLVARCTVPRPRLRHRVPKVFGQAQGTGKRFGRFDAGQNVQVTEHIGGLSFEGVVQRMPRGHAGFCN